MYNARSRPSKDFFPNRWLNMVFKWKVLAPSVFVITIYLAGAFLSGSGYTLRMAAARGDLLILSALILMEAAFELRRVESRLNKFPAIFAGIILFFYGFLQFSVLTPGRAGGEPSARLLLSLSLLNCAVTLCSVVGSLYAFMIVAREAAAKRLSELAPPRFSRGGVRR